MLGILMLYLAYRVFDRLTPDLDTAAELERGNMAVAHWICTILFIVGAILCVSIHTGMSG